MMTFFNQSELDFNKYPPIVSYFGSNVPVIHVMTIWVKIGFAGITLKRIALENEK